MEERIIQFLADSPGLSTDNRARKKNQEQTPWGWLFDRSNWMVFHTTTATAAPTITTATTTTLTLDFIKCFLTRTDIAVATTATTTTTLPNFSHYWLSQTESGRTNEKK